jgi:hypothetical protein
MKPAAMLLIMGLPMFMIGCADPPGMMATSRHYQVPPDFDASVELHPYTSHLGPCPEGVLDERCANAITGSHYTPQDAALVGGAGNTPRRSAPAVASISTP